MESKNAFAASSSSLDFLLDTIIAEKIAGVDPFVDVFARYLPVYFWLLLWALLGSAPSIFERYDPIEYRLALNAVF